MTHFIHKILSYSTSLFILLCGRMDVGDDDDDGTTTATAATTNDLGSNHLENFSGINVVAFQYLLVIMDNVSDVSCCSFSSMLVLPVVVPLSGMTAAAFCHQHQHAVLFVDVAVASALTIASIVGHLLPCGVETLPGLVP